MTLRTNMKHYLKRSLKSLVVIASIGVILSQYQNCAPVGDGQGVGSNSSTSVPPGTINCALVGAPQLGTGPANQVASSGLGPMSGDNFPQNLNVPINLAYAAQAVDENCDVDGLNGINVNCNVRNNGTLLEVDLARANNSECVSGTATVTLRVTDSVCARSSNIRTFQVAVSNVCPQQVKVLKEASMSPAAQDQFGSDVAISGNTAVVLAAGDDERALNTGAAFVYNWNGTSWVLGQKLKPAGLLAGNEVDAVAISGNTIVIGSSGYGNYGGAFVYRYNGSAWVESQTLTPSLTNSTVGSQKFGWDVDIDGNTIAVGSPGYSHGGTAGLAGTVFIYTDSGSSFSETRVISASNRAVGDYFGAAVALSGGRLAVGAPIEETRDINARPGGAYVYELSSGAETILNGGADAPNGSRFGSAIDISGTRVVVGAPNGPRANNGTEGAVLTFNGSAGWVKEGTVRFGGETNGDRFGNSVHLVGNNLAVGAPFHSVGDLFRNGAAYFYTYTGGSNVWTRNFKYFPRSADRGSEDYFGESVVFGNGFFLGGSRAADESYINLGSAYFIRLP